MMDSTYLMMLHFSWQNAEKKKRLLSKKTQKYTNSNKANVLPGDIVDFSKIFPDEYDESKKMFYENNLHRYVKPGKSCLRNSGEK